MDNKESKNLIWQHHETYERIILHLTITRTYLSGLLEGYEILTTHLVGKIDTI